MTAFLTVFRKEMVDHLRDRRSILVAMIYPLMGPILLGLLFVFAGGAMQFGGQGPLVVPVVNPAGAPDLVHFLEGHGAQIEPVAADIRGLVSGGRLPFAVILPAPGSARLGAANEPLPVHLISNPARFDSMAATGRIVSLLNDYQRAMLRSRLGAAGLPASIMEVLDIEQENVGRATGPSVIMLSMIPPFLMFTLFIGGVHVALDAMSGERERGSFEPLMMNPVTRSQVLAGKLGAAIVFTLMAVGVQTAAFWIMLHTVPRTSLGLIGPPSAGRLALVVSVCLPIVVLAAATQLLISAVTRSTKEAQTYVGLLPLVPGIAGMVLAMAPVRSGLLLAAIPTFGQTVLMGQLVRAETVSWGFAAITALATLTVAGLLLRLGFRLYEREAILFPP